MMHAKLGTRLLRKGIDLSGLNPSLTPEFHTRVASVLTQRISLLVQTNSPRGAPRTDRRPSDNLRREIVVFRPPPKPTGAISQVRASPPAPAGPGCPYGRPYRRPHLRTTAWPVVHAVLPVTPGSRPIPIRDPGGSARATRPNIEVWGEGCVWLRVSGCNLHPRVD